MVGCLAIELHKFPEEIRMMPYSDAILLWHELEDGPPVRLTFAAFVGYERPKRFVKKPIATDELVRMQMVVGGLAPMPKEFKESILWAEEQKKKMGLA